MKLKSNWRQLVRQAWSMRLMALAGLLTGLEAILPLWVDSIPRQTFSVASVAVIASAMVARLLVQSSIDKDEK